MHIITSMYQSHQAEIKGRVKTFHLNSCFPTHVPDIMFLKNPDIFSCKKKNEIKYLHYSIMKNCRIHAICFV